MHILRQAVLLYGVTLEVIEAASRMLNCSEGKAACEPTLEPDHISMFLQPVQLHSSMVSCFLPCCGTCGTGHEVSITGRSICSSIWSKCRKHLQVFCDKACPSCCRLMFSHRLQPSYIGATVGKLTSISIVPDADESACMFCLPNSHRCCKTNAP